MIFSVYLCDIYFDSDSICAFDMMCKYKKRTFQEFKGILSCLVIISITEIMQNTPINTCKNV